MLCLVTIYILNINYRVFNNDTFYKHKIIYWSKNKEDLEPYLQANKYNL